MVPTRSKIALSVECMIAQRKIAEKHHRRFVREVQQLVTAAPKREDVQANIGTAA